MRYQGLQTRAAWTRVAGSAGVFQQGGRCRHADGKDSDSGVRRLAGIEGLVFSCGEREAKRDCVTEVGPVMQQELDCIMYCCLAQILKLHFEDFFFDKTTVG